MKRKFRTIITALCIMLFGTLQANAIDINDSILFEEMFNTNRVFTAEQTLKIVKDTKDDLQNSITEIDNTIETFIERFDPTDVEKLTSIESRLSEVENRIETLDGIVEEVFQVKNRMTVVENKITNLETKMEKVEGDISILQNSLAQYGNTIVGIQNTLSNLIISSGTTIIYTNDVSTAFVQRIENIEQALNNEQVITLVIGEDNIKVLAPIDNN